MQVTEIDRQFYRNMLIFRWQGIAAIPYPPIGGISMFAFKNWAVIFCVLVVISISLFTIGCFEQPANETLNPEVDTPPISIEPPKAIPCIATVFWRGVESGDRIFVHKERPLIEIHADTESAFEQLEDDLFWAKYKEIRWDVCSGKKKADEPSANLWFYSRKERDNAAKQFTDAFFETSLATQIVESDWHEETSIYYSLSIYITCGL